ncbi:long-chain fatty acid--CoA ligase [Gordonia jinhuaensis]|uniref:Long-chain-fatty-acid--CoA ligase n=1 Tax=Gordonia jinhuaensis TaxID=1517702 RepID=A0A916WRA9_9ACTN|nr:AMP-binding protein [Gordonia jinhuaensis]GGB27091.1 long-chain-fatty-acid--CoA ligase [Gordonia jinhuaensis]
MSNLVSRLWSIAENTPERIALRDQSRTITYGQLREQIASTADHYSSIGVRRDDRVVFIAPSIPEFVVTYYALHALGATVITMNVMSTRPEIDYVVGDSGATTLIAWHECADALRGVADDRGLTFVAVAPLALGAEEESHHDSARSAAVADAYVDRSDDDVAMVLYTSGTTGRPKGAALTVSNINAIPDAFRPALKLTPDDRWATALPLFHCFGQGVVMHTALSFGCSLSLLSPFTPNGFMDMLRDHHTTIACGVPTMWNAMLQAADDRSPDDFASLRLACSGGAALPAEVIRAFSEQFGATILEGYGLTETAGTATFHNLDRGPKVATVGSALPGFSVEARDTDGHRVPEGEVGEIFISGPTVMRGYWNRPDATATTLVDGWLATGDLGTIDADGDIRIVDRTKDLIIRGGYNVYPREVEEILYEHPDIVEVAVIGVPHAHYGEEVAAVIAPRPGATIDTDALRTWAKERLSAYKVPRIFTFVDELPKGATGKILKRAIDRDSVGAVTQ